MPQHLIRVYHTPTGTAIDMHSVDAQEALGTGDYTVAPPSDQAPDVIFENPMPTVPPLKMTAETTEDDASTKPTSRGTDAGVDQAIASRLGPEQSSSPSPPPRVPPPPRTSR